MTDLPPILFSGDVQIILQLRSDRAARAWMHRLALAGVPLLRLGRRLALRRSDFERALAAFELSPPRRCQVLPKIDPAYVEMLKPRPRRKRPKRERSDSQAGPIR